MTPYETITEDRKKHEISSVFAYLIGVRKTIFENEHISLDEAVFNRLEADKNARKIRLLSIIRTVMIRYSKIINDELKIGKFSREIREFPSNEMDELSALGVSLFKPGYWASDYIDSVNDELRDRIESCKNLFPEWVEWQYIRSLFRMPCKDKKERDVSIKLYTDNYAVYPFQMYINWKPQDCGNLLRDDHTFLAVIYHQANDKFQDVSKVSDASESTKSHIREFFCASTRVVIVVDCENADPFRFSAALRGLPADEANKIAKIVLCDDVNSSTAWDILKRRLDIPIEHIMTERILEHKSVVDLAVVSKINQEHWRNETDGFILVSSDSDYSIMFKSLPNAYFLLMLEREKTSPAFIASINVNSHCNYCFTEDFYSGDVDKDLKTLTVLDSLRKAIEPIKFNVHMIIEEAVRSARTSFTPAEEAAFYKKYVKGMRLVIGEDGEVTIALGNMPNNLAHSIKAP